jgi:hypothetical protein
VFVLLAVGPDAAELEDRIGDECMVAVGGSNERRIEVCQDGSDMFLVGRSAIVAMRDHDYVQEDAPLIEVATPGDIVSTDSLIS